MLTVTDSVCRYTPHRAPCLSTGSQSWPRSSDGGGNAPGAWRSFGVAGGSEGPGWSMLRRRPAQHCPPGGRAATRAGAPPVEHRLRSGRRHRWARPAPPAFRRLGRRARRAGPRRQAFAPASRSRRVPRAVGGAPELPGVLRAFLDGPGRESRLRILICGSAVRVMQSLEETRSPLYGRGGSHPARAPVRPERGGAR